LRLDTPYPKSRRRRCLKRMGRPGRYGHIYGGNEAIKVEGDIKVTTRGGRAVNARQLALH
jgi:hypothetical protein